MKTVKAVPGPDERPTIAGLVITKVTREFIPIKSDPIGGQTVGAIIDETLYKAAQTGDEIQSLEFQIEKDEWHVLARQIRGD